MKKTIVAGLLSAAVLLGAGCADDPAPTTENTGGGTTGGSTKIAYIVKAMSDQFWIDMKAGAETAAAEKGVELSFQAPEKETDIAQQVQMVENAVTSGVNAIVLSAADSQALIPAIKKANDASIPVVLVNDTVDKDALAAASASVVTYVGIDQYAAAELAGKYAVENLKEGNVVLLEGISGVQALLDRLNGFKDPVDAAGSFEIVAAQTANNDRNQAFNVMQNILTSNAEIDIVWAVNAEMGQGAIQAIQQSGYDRDVAIFDFDASADDIQAIKDGTLRGSVAQYPNLQAEGAIQAALDAIEGKTLEEHTVTPAELITADNVAEFEAKMGG